MVAVSVPGSSANLGAGFDVLGMALDVRLRAGVVEPADGTIDDVVGDRHPTLLMYRQLGGRDDVWVRSAIPMGRGLGFSGAARVAGAALALAQRDGLAAIVTRRPAAIAELVEACADAEGHADNVAASAHGGVVIAHGGRVVPLRVGATLGAAPIVAWVPASATSTSRSRRTLPDRILLADAVHNIGATACFVAAVEHDDPTLLQPASVDRLHQDARLARRGDAAAALAAAVAAGAWCAWLSGSGPTIACWVDPAAVSEVVASLDQVAPDRSHVKVLAVDLRGVVVDDT